MSWLIKPDPSRPDLTQGFIGWDETGEEVGVKIVPERPLTLYLNRQEIVTLMTILDEPRLLALGFLVNQHMLQAGDQVETVDFDEDLGVVVVRTGHETNFETKLKKRVQTSGCAQGSSFGDLLEDLEGIELDKEAKFHTSWLYKLVKEINQTPSLYLEAGAIHGCVLTEADHPLIYTEDVGRHNAVDKIAGWIYDNGMSTHNKALYTTGRLTSEMVIKTVKMGIPVLVSRSGFTGWAVELARKANLLMIGRARGQRFTVLSGESRLIRDAEVTSTRSRDNRGEAR